VEIQSLPVFLDYVNKVHERTMRVARCIPADEVDWSPRQGKFTLGDLARHIALTGRYIFAETAQGKPSRYVGCGKEFAASRDEILALMERLHRESVEILSGLSDADLQRKCVTPDGSPITTWKWLRSMIEHEIHHRGQLYTYIGILGVRTPPLYGLTSEQAAERSAKVP
jgi:uncharacterized damage-inducible protein DinB